MRRLLPGFVLLLGALPGGAVAASPTVRLAIVHAVQGCHVWATEDGRPFGATRTLSVRRGTAVQVHVTCPMDFTFTQLAGPALPLGDPVTHTGTTRTIVFAKPGLYRLRAVNVQSSEQQGLQTLGPDNVLVLSVRVR